MSSQRDKKSGYIYKLCKRLEDQIVQEYDSDQQQATIRLESDSEDEQEVVISTTTSEALLSCLKKICSDSEESSNELPGITGMPSVFALQNGSSMSDFNTVVNMFTSLSKQIAGINKKTDRVQKDVVIIMDRLERVEKKMGISVETLEKVKDIVVKYDETDFVFKKISNEKEFIEFDTKLGTDKEYYSDIKKDLTMHIQASDPDNRMHQAIDVIFDRKFMAQCNWTGLGRQGMKIAFGTRTNILKLFADIGSYRFIIVNEIYLRKFFKRKLSNAKQRVNIEGIRRTTCHRRKSKHTFNAASPEFA